MSSKNPLDADSEHSTSDSDTLSDRRERMLARLNARHHRPAKVLKNEAVNPNIDSLYARIQNFVLTGSTTSMHPEILNEIDNAMAMVPTELQVRRLKEAQMQVRSNFRNMVEEESKERFTFKSKVPEKKQNVEEKLEVSKEVEETVISQKAVQKRLNNTVEFVDMKDKTVQLDGRDGNDILLHSLDECKIIVSFNASAAHIRDVKRSTIIFAPVQSSVLIRNCEDLVISAAAQQIRVHNSHRMKLYIAVQGAVIIEECDEISVAPYRTHKNPDILNDNWRRVKDFNWLHTKIPSPHWKVMKEDEWEIFDV